MKYGNYLLIGRIAEAMIIFGRSWTTCTITPVLAWQLAENALEYPHSSAQFYISGEQGIYHVRNFMEMEDVVFNERPK